MINNPETRTVLDIRKDKRFQKKDVDFLWERTDRQVWLVEVKTDRMMADTGNIVYELTSGGNAGCFERSESDVILYYDYKAKIMNAMMTSRLRCFAHNGGFKLIPMGDAAEGYKIPVKQLIDKKIIYHQWFDME